MRKGQAALEFLITYGWAIMVVLAAIGALAYFGVLNPGNFLPNKCVASPGFSCVGKPQVVPGTSPNGYIAQAFTANVGYSVTYTNTTVGTTSTATVLCAKGTPPVTCSPVNTLVDGTTYLLVVRGTFTAGQNIKEDVTLTATNPNSGLTDRWVISISG